MRLAQCGKRICTTQKQVYYGTFQFGFQEGKGQLGRKRIKHLHASIVPIVTGERRKARTKPTEEGKRTYRKKANTVRLCADDVLNRDKMVGYHDSYAEAMGKYGLKRGVRGSDARHTTTAQYYRNIKRETDRLQNCMKLLQSDIERGSATSSKDQERSQHGEVTGSKDGSQDRPCVEDRFSFGQWKIEGGGATQPEAVRTCDRQRAIH